MPEKSHVDVIADARGAVEESVGTTVDLDTLEVSQHLVHCRRQRVIRQNTRLSRQKQQQQQKFADCPTDVVGYFTEEFFC